ncbi:MAG: transglutaminase domain-containing protein [Bacteroidetes bacterium]|nr:transglutaminase domain-containing protein [Bacteroidota bacterium]
MLLLPPSTSYVVQPITVEKDFQKEFTSGYRSKSYVSDLNSAYFIYNSPNPDIVAFQQQRFDVLRKAKGYENIDKDFLNYYTFFPSNGQYRPVKQLADSLAKGKRSTIDKVLAVRDYFLAKNELGEQIFKYADNPGIPGLPGASKLLYFLFESKKGYCAYYAAATVFLLRSMQIPSRVVTGFLTVDRSDKNKGWYWFYEDQSHGWVQVYFPEYGWIDFDTTVGNDEAEQSPTPDGTPPMQPPNAVMAANGKIVSVDTLKKTSILKIERYIFKDVEYNQVNKEKGLDLRVANIWKDSIKVNLQYLKPNTEVMIVSYAEKLKSFSTEKDAVSLLNKLPALLPIDEVFIKSDLDKTKKTTKDQEENEIKPLTYYLKHLAFILLTCILLLFTIPIIVYKWYKYKYQHAKNVKEKAYYTYKSATFLLNQLQVDRLDSTPFYFAKHKVDTQFNTDFTSFMIVYLKSKYANQVLNAQDETIIHQFFKPFEQK